MSSSTYKMPIWLNGVSLGTNLIYTHVFEDQATTSTRRIRTSRTASSSELGVPKDEFM